MRPTETHYSRRAVRAAAQPPSRPPCDGNKPLPQWRRRRSPPPRWRRAFRLRPQISGRPASPTPPTWRGTRGRTSTPCHPRRRRRRRRRTRRPRRHRQRVSPRYPFAAVRVGRRRGATSHAEVVRLPAACGARRRRRRRRPHRRWPTRSPTRPTRIPAPTGATRATPTGGRRFWPTVEVATATATASAPASCRFPPAATADGRWAFEHCAHKQRHAQAL